VSRGNIVPEHDVVEYLVARLRLEGAHRMASVKRARKRESVILADNAARVICVGLQVRIASTTKRLSVAVIDRQADVFSASPRTASIAVAIDECDLDVIVQQVLDAGLVLSERIAHAKIQLVQVYIVGVVERHPESLLHPTLVEERNVLVSWKDLCAVLRNVKRIDVGKCGGSFEQGPAFL